MMNNRISRFEKLLAGAAFVVAAALAFTSLLLSEDHDIAAGVLMGCAQFLLLSASILHIDYKLNLYGKATSRNPQQQSSES
jgi:hypothetical protein